MSAVAARFQPCRPTLWSGRYARIPGDGPVFHLKLVGGDLQPGDPWKLPYIGVPYNLHRGGHVYFYREDESGGTTVLPPRQDPQLIQALRTVRPRGPVRFIVNPAGIVLTKCPLTDRRCSEE